MSAAPGGVELDVGLVGATPRVWRRLRVPSAFTLEGLHRVLQAAFDWENRHLYEFIVDGREFTSPEGDPFPESVPGDVAKTSLASLKLREGQKVLYRYDFGGDWELELEVVKVLADCEQTAACLDGARAAPPEDCGGLAGFAGICSRREWRGGVFYAATFEHRRIDDAVRAAG